jgi:regulator of sigma E protease
VLVHEAGHFIIARRNGVKVEEFGFGLPPRAIGFYKGNDGKWHAVGPKVKTAERTIWSFNWLPLGGFVRMKGEENPDTPDALEPDSFAAKGIGARWRIITAGVTMNLILAFILLTAGLMIGSPQFLDEENVPASANVQSREIRIVEILPDSPAAGAELQVGDTIISLDGQTFATITDFQNYVGIRENTSLDLTVQRAGEQITASLRPIELTETESVGIGVAHITTAVISYPWYTAWWFGLLGTLQMVWSVIAGFYIVLKNLIVQQQLVGEVYGPVGIAGLVNDAIQLGWLYVIQFSAVLSVILAVVNYLPIPALDGGHALFLLIEKIRGRKVNQVLQARVTNIGFMLLMLLILVITVRDITRFF